MHLDLSEFSDECNVLITMTSITPQIFCTCVAGTRATQLWSRVRRQAGQPNTRGPRPTTTLGQVRRRLQMCRRHFRHRMPGPEWAIKRRSFRTMLGGEGLNEVLCSYVLGPIRLSFFGSIGFSENNIPLYCISTLKSKLLTTTF